MRSLQSLKREASQAARFRGHKLGPWEDHPRASIAECRVCSKEVVVTPRPMPNEIDIGGPAVAVGCSNRNNPGVKVVPEGSNATTLYKGPYMILFSYQTPVAVWDGDKLYVTDKKWSVTTSKHINKWVAKHWHAKMPAMKIPQEQIEALVEK